MSLETAKTVAIVVVIVFAAGAIASAWLMKTIVQKVVSFAVLAVLAAIVWSQRASLQDCADKVKENLAAGATADTTCSFFGTDVTIKAPRRDD
jgi:uncharacterized membrane protein YfcA